jgi:RNA polymerase sigma factor (sigma-70 family)
LPPVGLHVTDKLAGARNFTSQRLGSPTTERYRPGPESVRGIRQESVQVSSLFSLYRGVVQDALMDEKASGQVAQLYEAEAPKMWRALVGFTANREIANDAVAEAFARALRDASSIEDLRSWTWAVAFRIASAELRRSTVVIHDPRAEDPGPSDSVPELVRALRLLPTNQRLALVLHDYADRPTPEVAAVLGCSRATVHVHLSRGRRKLRELLEVRNA